MSWAACKQMSSEITAEQVLLSIAMNSLAGMNTTAALSGMRAGLYCVHFVGFQISDQRGHVTVDFGVAGYL